MAQIENLKLLKTLEALYFGNEVIVELKIRKFVSTLLTTVSVCEWHFEVLC